MKERINKFLASHGICSRREADRLIATGQVTINGQSAKLGDTVSEQDAIKVDGRLIITAPDKIYLMVNKPVGVITTTDQTKKDNIIDLVGRHERLFPIGRLDVESSGLLLLTNDGELANQLTHPRYEHEKEYLVTIDRDVKDTELKQLVSGVRLADGPAKAKSVRRVSPCAFVLVLQTGRNRQVRRMCETLNLNVIRLKRTRVHNLMLGSLKPGAWRELTKKEITQLKAE